MSKITAQTNRASRKPLAPTIETAKPLVVPAKAIATALSVTTRYVLQLEAARSIPSIRFGRRCVRFVLADVMAALGIQTGGLAQ